MLTSIDVRNVHQALPEGAWQMVTRGTEHNSRNGKVLVLPGPCATTYRRPWERVEFHASRDSNPFFHLMESLWMLGGRDDVAFVARYSSNISQFSDDGVVFNGAYGYRWREWFQIDQLHEIAINLTKNPNCRRQVLAMWDGHEDLSNYNTRDVPCNLSAVFQFNTDGHLDMTVFNRSNDLIWGAYGANAVHFSVLLEYMAAKIGCPMGHYYQISANTHVYEKHFTLVEHLSTEAAHPPSHRHDPYSDQQVTCMPMLNGDDTIYDFELDVENLLGGHRTFSTRFFQNIVHPMVMAYDEFKELRNSDRHRDALSCLAAMPPENDWRRACRLWLNRRMEKANAKQK